MLTCHDVQLVVRLFRQIDKKSNKWNLDLTGIYSFKCTASTLQNTITCGRLVLVPPETNERHYTTRAVDALGSRRAHICNRSATKQTTLFYSVLLDICEHPYKLQFIANCNNCKWQNCKWHVVAFVESTSLCLNVFKFLNISTF